MVTSSIDADSNPLKPTPVETSKTSTTRSKAQYSILPAAGGLGWLEWPVHQWARAGDDAEQLL